jgi:hypothetical protein
LPFWNNGGHRYIAVAWEPVPLMTGGNWNRHRRWRLWVEDGWLQRGGRRILCIIRRFDWLNRSSIGWLLGRGSAAGATSSHNSTGMNDCAERPGRIFCFFNSANFWSSWQNQNLHWTIHVLLVFPGSCLFSAERTTPFTSLVLKFVAPPALRFRRHKLGKSMDSASNHSPLIRCRRQCPYSSLGISLFDCWCLSTAIHWLNSADWKIDLDGIHIVHRVKI